MAEFDFNKIPKLELWCSSTYARGKLRVTKQGLHAMVTRGVFPYNDLRAFDEDGRPRILFRQTLIDEMAAAREAEAAEAAVAAKEAEKAKFLKDVKLWARQQGIRVRNDRPVPTTLVRQYRKWLKEQEQPA